MNTDWSFVHKDGRDYCYLDLRTPLEKRESECEAFLEPYGFTLSQVINCRRTRDISRASWALMHHLVEVCGHSKSEVGRFLKKDRTSIIYGCAREHHRLTGEVREVLKGRRLSDLP